MHRRATMRWVVLAGVFCGLAALAPRTRAQDGKPPAEGLKKDLVGYWRFEEEGDRDPPRDSSGQGRDGEITKWCQIKTVQDGKLGRAKHFLGTGQYWGNAVQIPWKEIGAPKDGLSVAFWIKMNAWNENQEAKEKPGIWGRNEFIRLGHCWMMILMKDATDARGAVNWMVFGKNWNGPANARYSLPLGEWTLVAWTYSKDAGGLLYINGEPIGQPKRLGLGFNTDADMLKIGSDNTDCVMDEFAVWHRVLSPEEVKRLYGDGKGMVIE